MGFIILSPDKFSIHPNEVYPNVEFAKQRFDEWKERYEKQGYYSSNKGRIPLENLEENCTLVDLEDEPNQIY